jgi:hypothetical protein
METPVKKFEPVMRLVCQCSIPVSTRANGKAEYENLKVFLTAISPHVTLNGQIMEMLEPCCEKKEKAES